MKAVIYHDFGGLDVLRYADVPEPKIFDDEVLVRVRSCGVNFLDIQQRDGPPFLPNFCLPHIAGMDVSGDVVEVGKDVVGIPIGQRVILNPSINCKRCKLCISGEDNYCPDAKVLGGNYSGGYAEYVRIPASHVYAIPEGVSYDDIACFPTVFTTAWHALVSRGKLSIGETVLIHAAGSGVSTAAIQIAKLCGARVIATAGSEDKLERARGLGADVLVNYKEDDFQEIAKKETDGEGVDMVFDHVGPAVWQKSIFALRRRGRLVYCGATTGICSQINLPYTYHFGITFIGSDGFTNLEFEQLLKLIARGTFRMIIDSVYPLAEAREAHRRVMERKLFGKILLHPDNS